ncbi:MAG TPA: hypothetical protein VL576_00805 [Candidatus Paceibacterota bacterium]|jgi:hypothetical protein|nr:hypothetical protein [Candidatus Paceibacterota bacterium]
MKKGFLTLIILVSIVSFAKAQSITAFVTSNGLAPVPAFKLGKPAAFLAFDGNIISTKRFSLEANPDLGIDLTNGQGWFGDTWLQGNLKLDTAGRWIASAAIDWSLIFVQQANGKTMSVPYPTTKLQMRFTMDPKNAFDLESWYTKAIPLSDGIAGTYTSFQYTRSQQLGSTYTISATANLFYLDYSDGTQGFARSISASLTHKSGVYVACQFTNDINAPHVTAVHAFTLGFTCKIK